MAKIKKPSKNRIANSNAKMKQTKAQTSDSLQTSNSLASMYNNLSDHAEPNVFTITPDVKAYIHQCLQEFEPFLSPSTGIVVESKTPIESNEEKKSYQSQQYRISITLSDQEGKLSQEAQSENIFIAISVAKNQLLKTLNEIQDNVLSSQERYLQIDSALNNYRYRLH